VQDVGVDAPADDQPAADEHGQADQRGEEVGDHAARQDRAARADEFPHLAGAIDEAWREDERFETGLRWLLAGMAADLRSGA
jgi:hypothetical protein